MIGNICENNEHNTVNMKDIELSRNDSHAQYPTSGSFIGQGGVYVSTNRSRNDIKTIMIA